MKLKFVKSPGFRSLVGLGGTLHIKGQATIPDEVLLGFLAKGTMPTYLRGNFAFVFDGETETIAAVDHVATFPLFLTKHHIGGDFVRVAETLGSIKPDDACACTLDVCGGQSFNTMTSVVGVDQMGSCRYWRGGKTTIYIDLESVDIDPAPNLNEFREVVEQVIKRGVKDQNGLLLSAGTDSVTLAGITRKLNLTDRFRYVHVYSTQQSLSDKQHCEVVAETMKLPVFYFDQPYIGREAGGDVYYRSTVNWRDHAFAAKRNAMIKAGCAHARLLTGECGDQLFGGPKNEILAKYCAQVEEPDPTIIAHIWLNQSTGNPYTSGTKPSAKIRRWRETRIGGEDCYEQNVEIIGGLFTRLSHLPYVTRFMRMNLILKAPYRAYAYSQDDLDWWSPFTDWDIVSRAMRLGAATAMPGGVSKGLLLNLWRDWVSDRPWKVGKSGIMIPNTERHRA